MDQFDKNLWRPLCRLNILILLILLFTSCRQKKSEKTPIISFNKNPSDILLNEAKYSDIPIPIGFMHIDQSQDNLLAIETKANVITYQGSLSLDETLDFYYKTLEREGWFLQDFSVGREGLLVCSKPSKKIVISLREFKKNKIMVYIFIEKDSREFKKVVDINSKDITYLEDNIDQSLKFQDLKKG